MKKHFVRIVAAFFGFAALALTAKGQVSDQLVINVPYEFVAAGKTLPAGTYRITPENQLAAKQFALLSNAAR